MTVRVIRVRTADAERHTFIRFRVTREHRVRKPTTVDDLVQVMEVKSKLGAL